ncbi:MAG: hypothetical protein JWO77_390 [Ilumatobacteraceae bacterium]|nr:hypothetical protein [Ilumatobacteraceae bacterium]
MSDFGRMVPMTAATPMFLPSPPFAAATWSSAPPPPFLRSGPAGWGHLPPPPLGPVPRKRMGTGALLAVTAALTVGFGIVMVPVLGVLMLLSFGCGCT